MACRINDDFVAKAPPKDGGAASFEPLIWISLGWGIAQKQEGPWTHMSSQY